MYFTEYHFLSYVDWPVVKKVTMCWVFYWSYIYHTCKIFMSWLMIHILNFIHCMINNLRHHHGAARPKMPGSKIHWAKAPTTKFTWGSNDPVPIQRDIFQITPISKLYTDNTGRFPVHARSGHQYVMIAYHCDKNLTLAVPFKKRRDNNRLKAFNKIIQCLTDHKLTVDLQILENEASAEYKRVIKNR